MLLTAAPRTGLGCARSPALTDQLNLKGDLTDSDGT